MTDAEFANLPAVSIHAPVFPNRSFNPRTHEGATGTYQGPDLVGDVSIHAPMRVRLSCLRRISRCAEFQSTHP